MIRHVVLFKFKPGIDWNDPRALAAERTAAKVGTEVPQLRDWRYGRNLSTRDIAYDFLVDGLLNDMEDVEKYLVHPFHQDAIRQWREISDWVIVDVEV
ncbi:Dabb family protein [Actinomadura rudentiformis]|uniref:Dabb family protein n=1 Tax=Actinomadura rudentiformis TaxID=359158 RepID=A0A6H9YIK7_9ACTN|nr:Dabb family protein [Actinomadura rudentiformis]KAB2345169.1 Dabb family protein [Actinomadura rudentiformis]